MFIFERERERDRVQCDRGEGQRDRESQNLKQAPDSEQAISTEPDTGLKPTNCEIMT